MTPPKYQRQRSINIRPHQLSLPTASTGREKEEGQTGRQIGRQLYPFKACMAPGPPDGGHLYKPLGNATPFQLMCKENATFTPKNAFKRNVQDCDHWLCLDAKTWYKIVNKTLLWGRDFSWSFLHRCLARKDICKTSNKNTHLKLFIHLGSRNLFNPS